jgi:hypothetical protein
MPIISPTQQLTQLFDEALLNQIAKKVKFCERLREITPLRLITSLVSSFGDGKLDSIADLHRTFNGQPMKADSGVAYKPFHNQLRKEGFSDFMRAVTLEAMALFRQQLSLELPEKLNRFEQVLLHDGSSFTLHPELASVFPNRFKTQNPAAIECHMTMSLTDEQPHKLEISADTASERTYLPLPAELSNHLLLADAGYVSLKYMAELQRHGGFYVMRATKHLNPEIVRAFNAKNKEMPKLVGMKLKDLQKRRGGRARALDLDVRWQSHQCRMVLVWHKEEKRYLWWLTNLPRTEFSCDDIAKLYRIRWQIELLFKEWKSHNNLKGLVTRQPHLVKGLIWASLLSLLVKRFIGRVAQQRHNVRLSMQKVAKATQGWFEPILKSLANKNYRRLKQQVEWAIQFIAENCKRADIAANKKHYSFDSIMEYFDA